MSTILSLKKSNVQKKLYFYKTQKMNFGFLEKIIMDNLVLEEKLKLRKFL